MEKERIFLIRNLTTHRSYPVVGKMGTTLEQVWDSEKCWFGSGHIVTIVGPEGDQKTFVKE